MKNIVLDELSNIDRLGVSELPDRYKISRSVLYERMSALGIKTIKVGGRSYVKRETVELLDQLHEYINEGKTVAEFVEKTSGQADGQAIKRTGRPLDDPMHNGSLPTSNKIVLSQPSRPSTLLELPERLVESLSKLLEQPADELQSRRKLKEVAEEGWRLSTSELLALLMRSSVPPLDDHQRFSRMGFTFSRLGKVGRQYEWRVSKVEP